MENESNHYVLPEKVKSRLTEDGKGNYVFHHYSYSKRDVIKPTDGVGSDIVSKEELPALSSVGGAYDQPRMRVGNGSSLFRPVK